VTMPVRDESEVSAEAEEMPCPEGKEIVVVVVLARSRVNVSYPYQHACRRVETGSHRAICHDKGRPLDEGARGQVSS
jgi:hypothetical protein